MIFRSGICSVRPNMTFEQFTKHWIEGHGPLAAKLPEMHAYFQHHIVERIFEKSPSPSDHSIDSLSQLWWDDVGAMERAEVSPEYAACKRDLVNYQGTVTVLVFATVGEYVSERKIEGEASARLMVLSYLPSDAKDERVNEDLMNKALREAATPGLKKAFQYQAVDRAHPVQTQHTKNGNAPITGWTELVFENDAAIREWLASPQASKFFETNPTGSLMSIYRIKRYPVLDPVRA